MGGHLGPNISPQCARVARRKVLIIQLVLAGKTGQMPSTFINLCRCILVKHYRSLVPTEGQCDQASAQHPRSHHPNFCPACGSSRLPGLGLPGGNGSGTSLVEPCYLGITSSLQNPALAGTPFSRVRGGFSHHLGQEARNKWVGSRPAGIWPGSQDPSLQQPGCSNLQEGANPSQTPQLSFTSHPSFSRRQPPFLISITL